MLFKTEGIRLDFHLLMTVELDLNLICVALCFKVACALLMSGENLDNHNDVKDILVEMGTYFQVQVSVICRVKIYQSCLV